jgi:hypothetical protein
MTPIEPPIAQARRRVVYAASSWEERLRKGPKIVRAILVGLVQAVLLLSAAESTALMMYGSAGPFEVVGQTVPPGSVVIVDQENGGGTLVGTPVADVGLSGIAFNALGQLFGSTRLQGGANPGTLIQIDPLSGTLIETVGVINDGNDNIGISDLAFQPGTDVLFGISGGGGDSPCLSCLYTIDTESALATFVGQPNVLKGGGLAFAPDGTLYLTTTVPPNILDPVFQLVTLNTENALVLTRVDALLEVPIEVGQRVFRSVRFDGLGVRSDDGALFATQGGHRNLSTCHGGRGGEVEIDREFQCQHDRPRLSHCS